MTQPILPVSDERIDRIVSRLLAERAEDVAAAALSTEAMAERIVSRRRPAASGRTWVLLAAAALFMALVIGGALAVGGVFDPPSVLLPTTTPSPSVGDEVVHGWPDTSENEAGVYSWTGSSCGTQCISGFMHNGYGSGDVTITVAAIDGGIPADGVTAVTVAGHDGVHRRLAGGREEWLVQIEEATISIVLSARPGTSARDLAEAHAIIESMRTEPHDSLLRFRLLFTLTTDDWDSG